MVDVTDVTFGAEVLERSKSVPVVVDLWATWCGPCTTLGPMLERAVAARGGAIALAKVDVDANPQIAQMFQVQSIPAVFAVKDGRVVDSFIGAVGQGEIDTFLDRLTPEPTEVDLLIAAGDEASLRQALSLEPANARALVALASVLVEAAQPSEALELLAKIPPTPETKSLEAQARLAEQEIDVKSQEVSPLLDDLLERVKDDDGARQEFLDLLETLGPQSTVAGDYRKKLAARLF